MTTKSICFVTPDLEGIVCGGGIGTCVSDMAKLLGHNGWNVSILFVSMEPKNIFQISAEYFDKYGIKVYSALDFIGKAEYFEIKKDSNYHLARSELCRRALKRMPKFDIIEFNEWGALGFSFFQHKLTCHDAPDSITIMRCHGSFKWSRQGNEWTHVMCENLKQDYMEKYSFENADIHSFPTAHMMDYARSQGWRVKDDARIIPYPPPSILILKLPNSKKQDEIVFFGKFDVRKGITNFINAMNYLKDNYGFDAPVTFLGSEQWYPIKKIKADLNRFKLKFTLLSRIKSIDYLQDNAKLAVCPSLLDNLPNTVIECMTHRIPFITSRSGGIPELIGSGELYNKATCEQNTGGFQQHKDLAKLITDYFDYPEKTRITLLDLAQARIKTITNPDVILDWYRNCLSFKKRGIKPHRNPEVTVLMPFSNMPKYVEQAVTSLKNQTYQNVKIIINNNSDPDNLPSRLAVERIRKEYPDIRILEYPKPQGVGCAMNQMLPYVKSEYLVQFDSDNIAKPDMIKKLVSAIESRDKKVAAISCCLDYFYDDADLKVAKSKHKVKRYNKFIGPILPVMFFYNTVGDSNAIYRTEAIRKVGGWSEHRNGMHDWNMFINLVCHGYETDVYPESLCNYRERSDGLHNVRKITEWDIENIMTIQKAALHNPRLFYDIYPELHRLIRRNQDLSPRLLRMKEYFLGITKNHPHLRMVVIAPLKWISDRL